MDKEYIEVSVSFKVPEELADRFTSWLHNIMIANMDVADIMQDVEYLDVWQDEWLIKK